MDTHKNFPNPFFFFFQLNVKIKAKLSQTAAGNMVNGLATTGDTAGTWLSEHINLQLIFNETNKHKSTEVGGDEIWNMEIYEYIQKHM